MIKLMNRIKFFIILNLITFTLVSCGSIKDSVTNNKKNNSDEFLVDKKSPLIMPPDFDELPNPDMNTKDANIDQNKFKNLLSDDKTKNSSNNSNTSLEGSILEKIKTN